MPPLMISALSPEGEAAELECFLSRKWTAYSPKKDIRLSVEMILIDKEGNDIWGIISLDKIRRFDDRLREQTSYKLGRFTVKETREKYRPVPNPFLIQFEEDTTIDEIEPLTGILPYKFRFLPPADIPDHCDSIVDLLDIAGPLLNFSDVEQPKTSTNKTPRRDIFILLPDGKQIKVALWGRTMTQIDHIFRSPPNTKVNLVITSVMVKSWHGEHFLSSSSATKIYANLNVPDINIPLASPANSVAPQKIGTQARPTIPTVNIEELEGLRAAAEKKQTVALDCTVVAVKDDWFYHGCPNPTCRRVLTQKDVFYCATCKSNYKEPTKRFRTVLSIADHSGEMDVVLLDHAAEKYLTISAHDLYVKCGSVDNPPPEQLLGFLQKQFRLHISLTEYDFTHPMSKLSVQKIMKDIPTSSTKSTISNPNEGQLNRCDSSLQSIVTATASPNHTPSKDGSTTTGNSELQTEENNDPLSVNTTVSKRKRKMGT